VEGMDPRDHRTSVVHSTMKNLLQAHLNPAVQVVQPHSAPRDRSPPRSPSAPENTPPTDVQVWGTQIPPTTPEPARGCDVVLWRMLLNDIGTGSSFLPLSNRDKLVVAIDFGNSSILCSDRLRNSVGILFTGTTFSGVVILFNLTYNPIPG